MKLETEIESIKENRGDFRFELARLQTIISQSMQRFPLPLTLILQTLLLLQLLRCPFSYLPALTSGDQAWPFPIFSYLVPAYYQIFVNDNEFVIMTLAVLTMMILYLCGVALLIVIPQENKVSRVLSKVMKVMLELNSTIIYSTYVKTVASIYNCSSPNRSTPSNKTEFICYATIPSWVEVSVLPIFCVFSVVLMMQGLVKYDFYVIKGRASLLKRNQMWIPLLMILHIVIEFISTIYPPIASLVAMNVSCVVILGILGFVCETRTSLSTGINWGVTLSITSLVLLIDFNYIFSMPLSYMFWGLFAVITMVACMLCGEIPLKYQLHNINKWNSAPDRLHYCLGLRNLLEQKRSIRTRALMEGYADIHQARCQIPNCPFRMNQQAVERVKIFRENKALTSTEVKFEELIIKIYEEGTKFFPTVASLNIEFAIFLYERGMKEKSLKFLLSCSLENSNIDQYYKFYSLRRVLHDELISKGDSTLDLLTELQMRDLEEEFLRFIEKTSLSDLELWSVLLEEHPDFGKVDQVGSERICLGEKVDELYQKIAEMGNSQRVTALYIEYLINVCKLPGNFNDMEAKIRKTHNLDDRIMVFDWANSSSPSYIISGEEKSFGVIQDLNLSGALLLGYEKSELINRNLSFIMPESLSGKAEELVSFKEPNKEFFFIKKDRYLIRVSRKLYISSSILKGSIFICTVEPAVVNPASCMMLISKEEPHRVAGLEPKCINFFGIEVKNSDEMQPLSQISQWLDNLVTQNKSNNIEEISAETFLSPHLVRRVKLSPEELHQKFTIKVEEVFESILKVQFIHKKSSIPTRSSKPRVSDFRFQPVYSNSALVFCNNLTTDYEYITNVIPFSEDCLLNQAREFSNYGKGIRIVRLQENQVQVIEESLQEELNEETDGVQQTEAGLLDKNQVFQHKQTLETKESFYQFLSSQNVNNRVRNKFVVLTLITLVLFVVILCVFDNHHTNTISGITIYIDENKKIGDLQALSVLIMRTLLLQKNRSTVDPVALQAEIVSTLSNLELLKNSGIMTSLESVLLDGTKQILNSVQFIDSFSANIQYVIDGLKTPLSLPYLLLPIDFFMINAELVYPQMLANVQKFHNQLISSLNGSIEVQTIIVLLFIMAQGLVFGLVCRRMYMMFNDKILVLRVFLEITEQKVRIMSIKSEQFLNTLYNNETDIDDEESIIRKTNNKHTFAIKKKYKLINRDKGVFWVLVVLTFVLMALAVSIFVVSANSLVFTKNTLPFVNSTSGGRSFYYRNLYKLQLNIYNTSLIPRDPGDDFVTYSKRMTDIYYDSFYSVNEFTHYWIGVLLGDICSGQVKVKFACLSPGSKNGGTSMITQLVLMTQVLIYTTDFSEIYYNTYKIVGEVHRSMRRQVLLAYQKQVDKIINLIGILFVAGIIITPLLLLVANRVARAYCDKIQQTRKMLWLLPLQYLKSSEVMATYITEVLSRSKCNIQL